MRLDYDEHVDAAYVEVTMHVPDGGVDVTERLDQDRAIDRDAEDRILGYEFLNARRYGVRIDDLEHRDGLRALFRAAGFAERDWSAPLSSLHGGDGRRKIG